MIFLLALVALLAFSAGFLAGCVWASGYHERHARRPVHWTHEQKYARRDEWPGS